MPNPQLLLAAEDRIPALALGSTAFVFPGQGSQRTGMARDFHASFAESRAVFDEASEALSLDVAALCFEEDARLDLTELTQPALLTAELAMLRGLEAGAGLRASCYGGHSLGEYTALCAAGVLPLAVAVRLVRRRGALMQKSAAPGHGAMAAVVTEGLAARDLSEVLAGLEVDVASLNAPNQVVLSGARADLARACARITALLRGVEHQIVPLNVSAPFHSRLMRGIEPAFRAELEAIAPQLSAARAAAVTSNLTGDFHQPALGPLLDALTRQVSGAVDWISNMRLLSATAARIYEIGPSRPLRSLFRAVGCEVTSILSVKDLKKVARG